MRYHYTCTECGKKFTDDHSMAEHTSTMECECGETAKQDIDTFCKTDTGKRIFYED